MCGILSIIQKSVDISSAEDCLSKLKARGPDQSSYKIVESNDCDIFMGFARLAIMDTSDAGQQPFEDDNGIIICNGEIYNYLELAEKHGIKLTTSCDCEILLPLCHKVGFCNMIKNELDGEFAIVYYDKKEQKVYAARDRHGVRPLYYGYNDDARGFGSELKSLQSIMSHVEQVDPTKIIEIDLGEFSVTESEYYSYDNFKIDYTRSIDDIKMNLRQLLTRAVERRLHSDRPLGFLLSGGLDSSLITAIATKILGPDKIVCFSIGVDGSPDVEASKKVVEYLGIKHHHIIPFDVKQSFESLSEVVQCIETYDVTTIRASTPQYFMAKYIRDNTDIRVILSGEGSDEEHGSYRYFRDALTPEEFHKERIRLLKELHWYDNKRTDRTLGGNGEEGRIPFLDYDYVKYVLETDPKLFMHSKDYMEKMLLRDAFQGYLPDEILYRSKEAFSDAVSSNELNWATYIQKQVEELITDQDLRDNEFAVNKPLTKDGLYFRRLFASHYPGRDNIIPGYWLPRFQKELVLDPSARVLKSY